MKRSHLNQEENNLKPQNANVTSCIYGGIEKDKK